jgi:hypothetical protein
MIRDEGLHPFTKATRFWSFSKFAPNAHRSQIEEEGTRSVLLGLKSHFLPSRFLSGSRAWTFCEHFGSQNSQAKHVFSHYCW